MVWLNKWLLHPSFFSLIRSWITCIIGSVSLCCGHNRVFSGWVGREASCSLISFLLNQSRSRWFPLTSGSSDSFFLSPKVSSLSGWVGSKSSKSPKSKSRSPFSFLLSPFYMKEPLEVTSLFHGNDGFPVIITFCVFGGSFCGLQSYLW